jgi:hypothetical protein
MEVREKVLWINYVELHTLSKYVAGIDRYLPTMIRESVQACPSHLPSHSVVLFLGDHGQGSALK